MPAPVQISVSERRAGKVDGHLDTFHVIRVVKRWKQGPVIVWPAPGLKGRDLWDVLDRPLHLDDRCRGHSREYEWAYRQTAQ